MPLKPDISDRIRKLIAKAKDSAASEAEAASFMAAASALMEKHNLSRAEVNAPKREYERSVAYTSDTVPLSYVMASAVVEAACEVHCVIAIRNARVFMLSHTTIEIFGDKSNVEAATEMLRFLAGSFEDLYKAHRLRTIWEASDEAGYYEGLRAGLLVRLKKEKEERERKHKTGTALAVSRARLDEAYAKEFPNVETLMVEADRGSFDAGARDSGLLSLRRRVEG